MSYGSNLFVDLCSIGEHRGTMFKQKLKGLKFHKYVSLADSFDAI